MLYYIKLSYKNTYLHLQSTHTTSSMLENKMTCLLRAYKASKDNNNKTGSAACVEPFMDEMEDIFGNRPMMSCKHTINVGLFNKSTTPEIVQLPSTSSNENRLSETSVEDPASSSSFLVETLKTDKQDARLSPGPTKRKRNKSTKEILLDKKIEWEKEKENNRQTRFEAKMKLIKEIEENKMKRYLEKQNAK